MPNPLYVKGFSDGYKTRDKAAQSIRNPPCNYDDFIIEQTPNGKFAVTYLSFIQQWKNQPPFNGVGLLTKDRDSS